MSAQRFVRAHLALLPDHAIVARDGDVLVQVPYHMTFPRYGDLLRVTRRKDCNAWVMLGGGVAAVSTAHEK